VPSINHPPPTGSHFFYIWTVYLCYHAVTNFDQSESFYVDSAGLSQSVMLFYERLEVNGHAFQCLIFLPFLQKPSENKIRSWTPWESEQVITVLARTSSNCQSASSFRNRTILELSTSQAITSNDFSVFMLRPIYSLLVRVSNINTSVHSYKNYLLWWRVWVRNF
jgi:hypothetical protein